MKALILAAGFGTRLKPLTDSCPKPMIQIGGKPCLEHIVDHLNKFGITEIVVNIHWLYPQIVEYFGNRLLYSYEPELLGAEETEKRLRPWLGKEYFVCNGDTLTDLDLNKVMNLTWDNKTNIESWDKVYTGTKFVASPAFKPAQYEFNCYWQDIGTPEGLAKAREKYEQKKSDSLS